VLSGRALRGDGNTVSSGSSVERLYSLLLELLLQLLLVWTASWLSSDLLAVCRPR